MASCTCENWTLEDLSKALQHKHKDNKVIAVPMFQRGKRWNKGQQQVFIDSLIKGYPVGTMLFYETFENGQQTYILVDGLQRGNSIKTYMNKPTDFFYDSSISDDFCEKILGLLIADQSEENYSVVRKVLTDFIKEQKTFKNLQYFEPAKAIAEAFGADYSCIGKLIEVIGTFFDERQSLYDQIAMTIIPVIVYHGDESNLPEIFDRINSQGTPLDPYEVYAASWPVSKRFVVNNEAIVEAAIKKYDAFIADGFSIHGYNREEMRTSKKVNAFEYLFGMSKYLVERYDVLGFNKSLAEDTVNPLGFELINACLNESDRIKTLYQNIYSISDIAAFERALYTAIDFVVGAVAAITRFKGNSRTGKVKLFHSKYQILSMISSTFKEMYKNGDYSSFTTSWESRKGTLHKNLRLYYVYDIITNYWYDGGPSKLYSASKTNRYMQDISPRAWKIALDSYFERTMFRTESRQIAGPKSEEFVVLNCIYLSTFTAMDQLSIDRFDVEHIAPKEQLKRLIAGCSGTGLPISSIANLCYLPEYVNRSKKDRNFYQDTTYLQYINLDVVEQKFSFTTREDLEWMDMPYEAPEDFEVLKQFYTEFCTTRFETMKKLFCVSMGIDYDAMQAPIDEAALPANSQQSSAANQSVNATINYAQECVARLEALYNRELVKIGRAVYRLPDKSKGFVILSSKAYKQGQREKYWYGYRKSPFSDVADCDECYVVLGCKNAREVLLIKKETMDERTEYMNYSMGDNNEISHWHVVLFRDSFGHMTQLLSHPEVYEIDIDEHKI